MQAPNAVRAETNAYLQAGGIAGQRVKRPRREQHAVREVGGARHALRRPADQAALQQNARFLAKKIKRWEAPGIAPPPS